MSEHTPGPWRAVLNSTTGRWEVRDSEGFFLAAVHGWNKYEANARLMARAPDLERENRALREKDVGWQKEMDCAAKTVLSVTRENRELRNIVQRLRDWYVELESAPDTHAKDAARQAMKQTLAEAYAAREGQ